MSSATSVDNHNCIYRLRSCDALIYDFDPKQGRFEELESQTIFLAESTSFNDPLEDFVYLTYKGDEILWESMFREFVICLEYALYTSQLYDENNIAEFYKQIIHSPKTEHYFQAKNYTERISAILDRFFEYEAVSKWISLLSKRNKPIDNTHLIGILSIVSHLAMESILYVYSQNNYKDNFANFADISSKAICSVKMINDVIISNFEVDLENDSILEKLWVDAIANNILYYSKSGANLGQINYFYFLHDFPKRFVEELRDYVYYRWYAAAFMHKFPQRMDI